MSSEGNFDNKVVDPLLKPYLDATRQRAHDMLLPPTPDELPQLKKAYERLIICLEVGKIDANPAHRAPTYELTDEEFDTLRRELAGIFSQCTNCPPIKEDKRDLRKSTWGPGILTPYDVEVITQFFGLLHGGNRENISSIAKTMDTTYEGIRTDVRQAMRKLNMNGNKSNLEPFYSKNR